MPDLTLEQLESSPEYQEQPHDIQKAISREYISQNGPEPVFSLLEKINADDEFISMPPEEQQTLTNNILDFYGVEPPEQEGSYSLGGIAGGIKDVGKLLYDIPVQTKGAIGNLLEDDDPRANKTFADRWVSEADARTKQRQTELTPEERSQKVLPLPGFLSESGAITRGDISDTSQSTGFSLTSMGAGLGGFAAGSLATPLVGVAGGMSASAAAAYRMDKAMVTRELFNSVEAELGREMTEGERKNLLDRTEEIRSNHALWEAGPEAVGNALSMTGLGKIFSGAAKGATGKIISGLITSLGGELSTETITQIGQNIAEHEMGIGEGDKMSFSDPSSYGQALKEVGPQVVTLSGLMGGGSAVAGKVKKALTPKEIESEISNIPLDASPEDIAAQIDGLSDFETKDSSPGLDIQLITEEDKTNLEAFRQLLFTKTDDEVIAAMNAATPNPVLKPYIDDILKERLGSSYQGPTQEDLPDNVTPPQTVAATGAATEDAEAGASPTLSQPLESVESPLTVIERDDGRYGRIEVPEAKSDRENADLLLKKVQKNQDIANGVVKASEEEQSAARRYFSSSEYNEDLAAISKVVYPDGGQDDTVQPIADQDAAKTGAEAQDLGRDADIPQETVSAVVEEKEQEGSEGGDLISLSQETEIVSSSQSPTGEPNGKDGPQRSDNESARSGDGAIPVGSETRTGTDDVRRDTDTESSLQPTKREAITNPESAAAGQEVDTSPTEKEKEAGNYKKAHVKIDGLDISIENPAGSTRSGRDDQGNEWSQEIKADYGYFKGSTGYDKDHVDVFITPGYQGDGDVYVVNQYNQDGSFDEHKVVLGANSEKEALETYNSNYEEGWDAGKSVAKMSQTAFRKWVFSAAPKRGAVKRRSTANDVDRQNQADKEPPEKVTGSSVKGDRGASDTGGYKADPDGESGGLGQPSPDESEASPANLSKQFKSGVAWAKKKIADPEYKKDAAQLLEHARNHQKADTDFWKGVIYEAEQQTSGSLPQADQDEHSGGKAEKAQDQKETIQPEATAPQQPESVDGIKDDNTGRNEPAKGEAGRGDVGEKGFDTWYDTEAKAQADLEAMQGEGLPADRVGKAFHRETDSFKYKIYRTQQEVDRLNKIFQEKQDKIAQEEERKEAEAKDLDGFDSDMSPMAKGRVLKTLSKQMRYKGKVYTRRDLIRKLVKDGYRVNSSNRLESPDGGFLDIRDLTKTGLDYARFMQEKNPPTVPDTSAPDGVTSKNVQLNDEKTGQVEPPSFRDWRVKSYPESNSVVIVPNRIGVKFTESEIDTLVSFGKSIGLTATRKTPTSIKFVGSAIESMGIEDFGIEGVRAENEAAKKKEKDEQAQERDRSEKAKFASLPSSEWIDKEFASSGINLYNKLELAKFLDGESEKFNGAVSWKWAEDVTRLGAISEDGQTVDFEKLKEKYRSNTKPAVPKKGTTDSKNKVFTDDMYQAALDRMKERNKNLNSGFDPMAMQDLFVVGGYHFEKGVRGFAEWSKEVIGVVGENWEKFLPEVYSMIRKTDGIDKEGMSTVEEVEAFLAEKERQESPEPDTQKAKEYQLIAVESFWNEEKVVEAAQNNTEATFAQFFKTWLSSAIQKMIKNAKAGKNDYHIPSLYEASRRAKSDKGQSDIKDFAADIQKQILDRENKKQSPPTEDLTNEKPERKLAEYVRKALVRETDFTSRDLFRWADRSFGGTQGEGVYTPKDAYDALELGINLYLASSDFSFDSTAPRMRVRQLGKLLDSVPTQTKRTKEQDEFQQYSTPPTLAYAAGWVANIDGNDSIVEPSAGIGGLAVFAKLEGAKEITVNELSERRRNILAEMGFDNIYGENAEQLNNVLPEKIKPSVVLMNPPFSATGGRVSKNKTKYGALHIEQALKRLEPGGRLVAIVGEGMAYGKPTFAKWWKKIEGEYTVRANVGMNGEGYRKYGTTFDNQLLVIDKTGPTTDNIVKGNVDSYVGLIPLLQEVRDARVHTTQQPTSEPIGQESVDVDRGTTKSDQPVPSTTPELEPGKRDASDDTRSGRDNRPDEQSQSSSVDGTSNQPQEGRGRTDSDKRNGSTKTSLDDTGRNREPVPNADKLETSRSDRNKDATVEGYQPTVLIAGAKDHPADLVESAAMAAVKLPEVSYQPSIPKSAVEKGALSKVQLEAIAAAGQAHKDTLPNGETRGFFIGDGTGVGKGREIAGILWDNYNQGRKRSIWVSKDRSLGKDAKRDITGIGWDPEVLIEQGNVKAGKEIPSRDGVLYTAYSTVASPAKSGQLSRLDAIINWAGEDFDGVIAFDESHKMGNAIELKQGRYTKKPSKMALAALELQEKLPKAKVVYVSATGATEVSNLAYAGRLGLWGEGTPFSNATAFIGQIGQGGIAAMEVVARDMKAMGAYLARKLAFNGKNKAYQVKYKRLEHALSSDQREIYDELAGAWQVVLSNINDALDLTEANSHGKSAAMSQFWGSHQRFFNQVLTAMQMPSVLKSIRADVDKGNAVVLQITNTNEASTNRALAKAESLEDVDLTPRDQLMQMVENGFPVQQYEEYEDDNGNTKTRPVQDAEGNPVLNREAIQMRERLLDKLGGIRVPDAPLEQVLDTFGVDNVAEVTGRSKRIVTMDDGTGPKKVRQSWSKNKGVADAAQFMADKKQILIFSEAGGTGASYHAELSAKNQRKRSHYILQAGWRADTAIQGLGRSHRSNQAVAPEYVLVTTDLKGHKRFISSIARRLSQLGALTEGERSASSQGLFTERDNLESSYASDAVTQLVHNVHRGRVPDIDLITLATELGLPQLVDEFGQLNTTKIPDVPKFLNRLLSMKIDMQNKVFDAFTAYLDQNVSRAEENGTLDVGLETLDAEDIRLVDRTPVHTDKKSGAVTEYVQLDVDYKAYKLEYNGTYKTVVNNKSGKPWQIYGQKSTTDENGRIDSFFVLRNARGNRALATQEQLDKNYTEARNKKDAKEAWDAALKEIPDARTEREHLIAGALLPIWDKLKGQPKIVRVQTDDDTMLGRIVPSDDIAEVMAALDVEGKAIELSPAEVLDTVLRDGKKISLDNGWSIRKRKVADEDRIEIEGPSYHDYDNLVKAGAFTERISYITRVFVPKTDTKAIARILKPRKIMAVSGGSRGTRIITAEDGRAYILEDLAKSIYKAGQKFSEFVAGIRKKLGKAIRNVMAELKPLYERLNNHLDTFTSGSQAGAITVRHAKTATGEYTTTTRTGVDAYFPVRKAPEQSNHSIFGSNDRPDTIERTATTNPKFQDLWERFVYQGFDKDDPRRRVMERAPRVTAKTDILTVERLRGKVTADETERFMDNFVQPLLKTIAKSKLKTADLEEYAHALHAPERNLRMQQVNASRHIDMVKKHLNTSEREALEDELIEIRSAIIMGGGSISERQDQYLQVLDRLLNDTDRMQGELDLDQQELDRREFTQAEIDKGTPETLQVRLNNRQKHIHAIRTIKTKWDTESPRYAGITDKEAGAIVRKWNSDKRIAGLKEANRLLAKINKHRLEVLYEGGQLSQEEYQGLVHGYRHYVPLHRDVGTDGKPSTGRPTGPLGRPIQVAKGSMAEVVEILAHSVRNTQVAINRKHKAKAGEVLLNFALTNPKAGVTVEQQKQKPTHDRDGNIVMYPEQAEADNELYVKVNGERHILTFDTRDKTVARFLQSIKEADTFLKGPLKTLAKTTRFLAAVNTTLSPEFILSNFTKDIQTAGVNLEDTQVKGMQSRIFKNVFPAIKGIMQAEYGKDNTKWGRIYRDFAASGGKIGWMQSYEEVTDLAKELQSELEMHEEGHIPKKVFRKVKDLISNSNMAIENGVRLAVYHEMTKVASKQKAAMTASNLTVDFTRRGASGPAINALYMFFNAGVQGNIRIIKALSRSKSARAMVGGVVGLGFALQMLAYASGEEDDRGQPYIDGIPDYEKERNMIFMRPGTGGKYIKIPMPYGYNVFFNIGSELARAFRSGTTYDAGKGGMRLLNTAMGSFNPLHSASIFQTITPTILDPMTMIAENKTFTGAPVMPEKNPYGVDKADAYRYWKSASGASKWIAQSLNKITGGKGKYEPGVMDFSPETIELWWDTLTGSAGRFLKNVGTATWDKSQGKEIETSRKPFIRRIAGEWSERSISSDYYDEKDKIDRLLNNLKHAQTPQEKRSFSSDPLMRMVPMMKETEKRLRALRKNRDNVEARGGSTDIFDEKISQLQSNFLKRSAAI